jgi:hypothetical protein
MQPTVDSRLLKKPSISHKLTEHPNIIDGLSRSLVAAQTTQNGRETVVLQKETFH